jgi:hypothetical protein
MFVDFNFLTGEFREALGTAVLRSINGNLSSEVHRVPSTAANIVKTAAAG